MTGRLTLAVPRYDETLYSVVARTSYYLGGVQRRAMQSAIVGDAQTSVFDDMPVGLDALLEHAGLFGELDCPTVIGQFTLFPYYSAFSTAERRAKAEIAMRGSGVWPHQALESWVNGALPPERLRFCNECHVDMLSNAPDRWWRRTHQLPSSLVCPDHVTILRSSRLSRSMRTAGAYARPSDMLCSLDSLPVTGPADADQMANLLEIAKLGDGLLKGLGHQEAVQKRAGDLAMLETIGLLGKGGIPALALIAKKVKQRWGDTLKRWAGLEDEGECRQDWLGGLLMRRGLKAPPIHHLLLGAALGRV